MINSVTNKPIYMAESESELILSTFNFKTILSLAHISAKLSSIFSKYNRKSTVFLSLEAYNSRCNKAID